MKHKSVETARKDGNPKKKGDYMGKRSVPPVITHTEILTRAISSVEHDIQEWEEMYSGIAAGDQGLAELKAKRDALKVMYFYETASNY